MAAENCHVKLQSLTGEGVSPDLGERKVAGRLLSRGQSVTVRDWSLVERSPHTKNQLDLLRCLVTINERYSQPDGVMDGQADLL